MNTVNPPLVPRHEKLFDEICNKLNELSHRTEADLSMDGTPESTQQKYEKMQNQMKKFHNELQESQEEIKEKIKTLGSVSYASEGGLDIQFKQLAEQLHVERSHNTKLSTDLAKSLEVGLQLQLEIQGLKARSMQIQTEEKKYSHALFEKNKHFQKELELSQALKDEMSLELIKAKSAFQKEQDLWEDQRDLFEKKLHDIKMEKAALGAEVEELKLKNQNKDQDIKSLNEEIGKISTSFNEVEFSAEQQGEVLQNLMQVAESKIVEMKLALDKKSLEAQDYYSHLQQALTQLAVFKQESASLKDYVTKLNEYHQQMQMAQQQAMQVQVNQAHAQSHV